MADAPRTTPSHSAPSPCGVSDASCLSIGPTVYAPGMLDVSELGRVGGFELRYKGRLLGVASLSPVPTAALNAEGGFKPPPEFAWSNAADDELSERLGRLMNGG